MYHYIDDPEGFATLVNRFMDKYSISISGLARRSEVTYKTVKRVRNGNECFRSTKNKILKGMFIHFSEIKSYGLEDSF